MSYDVGQGEPIHTTRMRRMMRFVRGLIDDSGYSLGQIAKLATTLAERDGLDIQLNLAFVGRLGGQGDWYLHNADDFFYMRVYYVLRALNSSMSDLERAMEHPTEESAAEEVVLAQAFRRVRHPELRAWVLATVRDAANLDASLVRAVGSDRAPYVMPGPFQPPVAPLPEIVASDSSMDLPPGERPSLGEMGQDRLDEAERSGVPSRQRKKR